MFRSIIDAVRRMFVPRRSRADGGDKVVRLYTFPEREAKATEINLLLRTVQITEEQQELLYDVSVQRQRNRISKREYDEQLLAILKN